MEINGKTYLGAVSGLWRASLGLNPERLQREAAMQIGSWGHYHSFIGRTLSPTVDLAARLVEKLPARLDHFLLEPLGPRL
ncbi:MAG: hypothetical protein R8G34_08950 [Paracoccaceae bacterium]|nr:hypothetical protein [Paracoccaceae bacterium]